MSEEEMKDRITISNCVYYETPLLERIERLQTENTKLKNHIEMQDLTIQKLYAQLNNPPTTISSSGYFQADIPEYTLTYCNTADEENTKLKQMWEEFKNTVAYDDGESTETYGEMCSEVINELEQKYKLGE